MNSYQIGDYVRRGANVFRVENVYGDDKGQQVIFVFGAWNAIRFQRGELIEVARMGDMLQSATKVEFIEDLDRLRSLINNKLDELGESVEWH